MNTQNYDKVMQTGINTRYYKDNKLHRIDGPAIIHADGDVSYYIEGVLHTMLEYFLKTGYGN